MKKLFALVAILFVSLTVLSAQSFNDSEKWNVYDDKNDRGSSTIAKSAKMVTIDGKELLAVTLTGTVTNKCPHGFAGVAVEGAPATMEALKTASGLTFMTNGDGKKYRVKVENSAIKDYDHYGFVFTAPKGAPVKIDVPFSKLTQEGWGAKKKFDTAKNVKLSFQTIGQPLATYELTVIDLKVTK